MFVRLEFLFGELLWVVFMVILVFFGEDFSGIILFLGLILVFFLFVVLVLFFVVDFCRKWLEVLLDLFLFCVWLLVVIFWCVLDIFDLYDKFNSIGLEFESVRDLWLRWEDMWFVIGGILLTLEREEWFLGWWIFRIFGFVFGEYVFLERLRGLFFLLLS